jgi:hypothetical protein
MENMIGWMIAGGVIGFWHGWRKIAKSTVKARARLDATPGFDKEEKAKMVGYNPVLQFVALGIFTTIGAVIGTAIWGVLKLLLMMLD